MNDCKDNPEYWDNLKKAKEKEINDNWEENQRKGLKYTLQAIALGLFLGVILGLILNHLFPHP